MAIPPRKGLNISLKSATPTPFDAATLKRALEIVGLNCAQISDANLTSWITTVNSQLPTGKSQAFAIKMPGNALRVAAAFQAVKDVGSVAARLPLLEHAATGNWTLDATGGDGYGPQLEIIAYPDHFNWLYDNRASNGFTGTKNDPPVVSGNYDNAKAIQDLFISVGLTASSTLVRGLDQDSMRAALTNVIQPLSNASLSNYDDKSSRLFFVVEDYNESTKVAQALGVVFINWELKIEDYKRKTKDGGDTHKTVLTLHAGSVTYSDPATLCGNYKLVVDHYKLTGAPACS